MKTCAVSSCKFDSLRRPDLTFFNLPRDSYVRGEWLEVIGVKKGESTYNLKVCHLHFRAKDFVAGKKQLKTHAVPVLQLGSGKADPLDSDDEFIRCDSDSDPEIVEIKKCSAASSAVLTRIKTEPGSPDDKREMKQEADDSEHETGRRPSRRAARVAAKKIYNTVRNYGLSVEADDDDDDDDNNNKKVLSTPVSPKITLRRRNWRAYHNIKVPPVVIDLEMECHEELLSSVQAEAALKTQIEYNTVMKSLRILRSNSKNVIIIEDVDPDDTYFPSSPENEAISSPEDDPTCSVPSPQSSSIKNETDEPTSRVKGPNIITVYPFRPDNAKTVYPTKLTASFRSSSPLTII